MPCSPQGGVALEAAVEPFALRTGWLNARCRQDFEWSPAEPVLAAYMMEQGNQPARIALLRIPERTELRQKNMLNVSGECRMGRGGSRRAGWEVEPMASR